MVRSTSVRLRILERRTAGSAALSLALISLAAAGCSSPRERQLDRVAKDWCQTIRASQVIPVYPLSEDVQPGDVFAVQTTIGKQAQIYADKGFLPLDQLVVRLPLHSPPDSDSKDRAAANPYVDFYAQSFWAGTWRADQRRPGWPGSEPQGETHLTPAALGAAIPAHTVAAPRAAFPSYTFEVQRGAGAQLAIPISGVPVGLGLMGSQQASGSVSIRDAYTYGLDIATLYTELLEWWQEYPEIQTTLARVAEEAGTEVYLRTVNRVYLTTGVTVALHNLESAGGGIDAGVSPELDLLALAVEDPAAAEAATAAYTKVLDSLSKLATDAAPGGSVRFTQASQRAVTLEQDFDRPLVIGYLGFDVRVLPGGNLGTPVPSFAVLDRGQAVPAVDATPEIVEYERLFSELSAELDEAGQQRVLTAAASALGGEFQRHFDAARESRGIFNAFHSAKNHYTQVETQAEETARMKRIAQALDTARRAEEGSGAGS
jgi:hypothetical protein